MGRGEDLVQPQASGPSAQIAGPLPAGSGPVGSGLRVLCVDDYGDIREVLGQILTDAGYVVTLAETAEHALELLMQQRFHLVVTDYNLPGANGVWLLRSALDAGLLVNTESLVLTGAVGALPGGEGMRVLRKPMDVDRFLVTIYEILTDIRQGELELARQSLEQVLDRTSSPVVKLDLTLYVSAASPSSLKALRNLERLLLGYDASQFRLAVVDLSEERPASADEDRIVFTPTLVKRFPEPRAYLLGNLENTDAVTDLLEYAEVEKKV